VRALEDFGGGVQFHDPMANGDLLCDEYDLAPTELEVRNLPMR
jgi:hypothetical protein